MRRIFESYRKSDESQIFDVIWQFWSEFGWKEYDTALNTQIETFFKEISQFQEFIASEFIISGHNSQKYQIIPSLTDENGWI